MFWSGITSRLGFRLGMLLSIAILPIGLISVIQTMHLSREAARSMETALQGRTAAAAAGERALLQGTIGTADALGASILTMLDDLPFCSEAMQQYVVRTSAYVYAGFVDKQGEAVCSSVGTVTDMRNTAHFQAFVDDPGTQITASADGPPDGQQVVIVSQPLYRDNELLGYVAISLNQKMLRSTHSTTYWADGARILTFSSSGQALSGDFSPDENPEDILPKGQSLTSLVSHVGTSFQGLSNSGDSRIFSVVEVVPDLVYALGSWSPSEGLVGLNVSRFGAILFPLALWAVSLAVAYFAVYRLVLRHVRELRGQMRRFALGDRTVAPPVLTLAPGEIRDVSETFHNMARILIRDEAAMEEAVAEKTVLLKEVHHRVKNNLQLIASIINMQSRMIDDNDAKRVLRSVQDRVASLATIYKNLYQAEHLDSVEADRLINDITGQMSAASVLNDNRVRIATELDQLTLPPDQAVPLTLLTTEAFTNALKYAGVPPGSDHAWVRVKLARQPDGLALLVIENSLGQPLEDHEGTGLGSQLIEAFAMQLDTEATTTLTDTAYRLEITFRPDRALDVHGDQNRHVVLTSAARDGARH